MAEWYATQERAFAPGIAGEWPDVIAHPTNRHGRLKREPGVDGVLKEAYAALFSVGVGRHLTSQEALRIANAVHGILSGKRVAADGDRRT